MFEHSDQLLPLVWACFLGGAISLYVLLDGFSLGVGILYSVKRNPQHRDLMISSITPVWDGNQTWLVGGGMALLTAFPKGFNLLLTVFYLPICVMLVALVFRGLALEFRFKTENRRIWDRALTTGSIVAAFCQGLILGNFVQGFDFANEQLFFKAGYLFNPFAVFTGVAVVIAYALIGGCWLVHKQEGVIQDWARKVALGLVPVVALLVLAVSILTPYLDSDIAARWFTLPNLFYLSPIPLWTVICLAALAWSLKTKSVNDGIPFLACIVLNLLVLMGLAASLFPWIVPRHFDIWEIAAPATSLSFAMVGVVLIVPFILIYTAHAYYVFRGKVKLSDIYH